MFILGINHCGHDASAVLVEDGRVVAAAEEERFNREKHTTRLPVDAIAFCLERAGITLGDVEFMTYFFHPWTLLASRLGQVARFFPGSMNLLRTDERVGRWSDMYAVFRDVRHRFDQGGKTRGKGLFVRHHEAHGASAFFPSPFERAAILSIDGAGERSSTWLGLGEGNTIRKLLEVPLPHSIGLFYAAVTDYLGFRPWGGEGKTMALAAFGEGELVQPFRRVVRIVPDGEFALDLSYFSYHQYGWERWLSPRFYEAFGLPRRVDEPIDHRHIEVAAAAQTVTEEALFHLLRRLYACTGTENLCLTGGVALNAVANGKILEKTPFRRLFIQPAAYDAGSSLGSALWLYHQVLGNKDRTELTGVDWGPAYGEQEIEEAIRPSGFRWKRLDEDALCREAARTLAAGEVVGWYQGRSEFGPRALGFRSILADPRDGRMKDKLNERIKGRESFRPFGLVVPEEEAAELFAYPYPMPHMIVAVPTRPAWRPRVPAGLHVDGTSRPQTVTQEGNPLLHTVLGAFRELTGVPALVNTSFNRRGEPMVLTPAQALTTFAATEMGHLFIGPYHVWKEGE